MTTFLQVAVIVATVIGLIFFASLAAMIAWMTWEIIHGR